VSCVTVTCLWCVPDVACIGSGRRLKSVLRVRFHIWGVNGYPVGKEGWVED
jgi:hypothetical protein